MEAFDEQFRMRSEQRNLMLLPSRRNLVDESYWPMANGMEYRRCRKNPAGGRPHKEAAK